MTIYQRMDAIFETAGFPGFLLRWQATDASPEIPPLYAIYRVAREYEGLAADDGPICEAYSVEIHLYAVGDPTAAKLALEDALFDEDFYVSRASELEPAQAQGGIQYHVRIDATYYDYL